MQKMTASALLALMQTEYPSKEWHIERFLAEGVEMEAVLLSVDGTGVHDPFDTVCGRGPQADLYGLKDEHARLLRRHNRVFASERLGAVFDLEVVFENVRAAIIDRPAEEAERFLDDFGFVDFHSGGGCVAYALFAKNDSYILVTDNSGCALPKTMGAAWVGLYDAEMTEIKGYFP